MIYYNTCHTQRSKKDFLRISFILKMKMSFQSHVLEILRIFIEMVVHLASLSERGIEQPENSLLKRSVYVTIYSTRTNCLKFV